MQTILCCLQSEEELKRMLDEFYSVCMRKKLKVKGKVFERREVEVVDFNAPCKVTAVGRCEIIYRDKMEALK